MIKIQNLNKSFGQKIVFSDFSMAVDRNEAVGLWGESGCGKTTLLRIISGLDEEYAGEVLLDGIKMEPSIKPYKRGVALVMQEPVLWSHMTVKENILYPLNQEAGRIAQEKLEDICSTLEIQDLYKRYPDQISGGQAKRVSLARALMANKQILLLDEPLSNIDSKTKDKVMEALKKEYMQKKTVLYVSHDKGEIEHMCSRIQALASIG